MEKLDRYSDAMASDDREFISNVAFEYFRDSKKIDPNHEKTIELLLRAIDKNDLRSLRNLAKIYLDKNGGHFSPSAAKNLLERAVEHKSDIAAVELAIAIQTNLVEESQKYSVPDLIIKASESKNPEALIALARGYESNQLGNYDPNIAKNALEKAASLNSARALRILALRYRDGKYTSDDPFESVNCLKRAIELGDVISIRILANLYEKGQVVSKDVEMAKYYYEEAIKKKDVVSLRGLAIMYEQGEFGEPNYAKAKSLYRQAIKLNDGPSAVLLAFMLRDKLKNVSVEKIINLLKKAVDQNETFAMRWLAAIYIESDLNADFKLEGRGYLEQAIELNDENAMFLLARYLEDGLFSARPEFRKAEQLFSKAADRGHAEAKLYLPDPAIVDLLRELSSLGVMSEDLDEIEFNLRVLDREFCKIRREHQIIEKCELSHFTSWSAISNILDVESKEKKTRLRKYHVDYMNDPTEGLRLLSFHGSKEKDIDPQECDVAKSVSENLLRIFKSHYFDNFSKESCPNELLPSIFMLSLTKASDRLDLWRAYGADGKGFCITLPFDMRDTESDHEIFLNRKTKYEIDKKRNSVVANRARGNLEGSDLSESEVDALLVEGSGVDNSKAIYPNNSEERVLPFNVKYSDKDVVNTLFRLSKPLNGLINLISKLPCELASKVEACISSILLELLYLYKDNQYESEQEARIFSTLSLGDERIKVDERMPGHLFCETAPFLFKEYGSKIILGPKVENKAAYLWNIRHRLMKLGFDKTTSVSVSSVPYR